ncbi:MAG: transcriptional regulator [Bacteroidetes bacterium]|nr:transcriptional regulator [Bacteroidota bacterium]
MNYIIHLNKAFGIFCEDERLTPFHVSLYFSLFQYWNMAKFRNPISISRDELMRASKIGSVNTYIRSIKELHTWNYIKYIPSYNPQKGSQVYLYTFDNSSNNSKSNSNDNGTDISHYKGTGKAGNKAKEKPVIPSINNSNKTNKLKHNKHEHTRSKNPKKVLSSGDRYSVEGGKKKKDSGQKRKKPLSHSAKTGCEWPLLSQVRTYFIEQKWPLIEAEKFFNHYSSNGWLVGGKTPMKNWQASATKWMLNSANFSLSSGRGIKGEGKKGEVTPGKLQTSNEKDYNEPL